MKRFLGCALTLGLLSIPGFAASNSKTVNFPDKLTVGTTELPAGDYKVTWTGTGPTVQVSIMQKNVTHPLTTTTAAKLVEVQNGHTGVTFDHKNGVDTLEVIQLNKINLVLADAPAQGQ
jgi:hypothetical protein